MKEAGTRPQRFETQALEAFLNANIPTTDRDRARAVYEEHCIFCCHSVDQPDSQRDLACQLQGCALRSFPDWEREAAWIEGVTNSPLLDAGEITPALLVAFNQYIHEAGCATFGIGYTAQGTLARSYTAVTLRGLLHAALVLLIAYRAGDRLNTNVLSVNTRTMRQLAGKARTSMTEDQQQRARLLRAQGRSYNAIAKELGRDRSTVRSWTADIVPEKGGDLGPNPHGGTGSNPQ